MKYRLCSAILCALLFAVADGHAQAPPMNMKGILDHLGNYRWRLPKPCRQQNMNFARTRNR